MTITISCLAFFEPEVFTPQENAALALEILLIWTWHRGEQRGSRSVPRKRVIWR